MAAHAAPAPGGGLTLTIRGRAYPVLLPKLSDPRLHLAAVITTLQVLGQTAFDFRLSIAQILISLITCAVLEVAITFKKQHVLMWPASALLTGNGVAFILRVPGTEHGDWWSLRGWWIYAATAAVSLVSKYVITWRGGHIFNPSNIGLVICFLALGRNRAEPLDFWWGPMSPWLAFAFVIIVSGGLLILSRLRLLRVAVGFWLSFAAGIAVLAAAGHEMTARWHLGPLTGFSLWWALLTSPEVLVFLFFMITDPRTAPKGLNARLVYAISVGLLSALLIAPLRTEYAHKVAVLGALAIVCLAQPFAARLTLPRFPARRLALATAAGLAAYGGALVATDVATHSPAVAAADVRGPLPPITILPSRGVQTRLPQSDARRIARKLVTTRGVRDTMQMWLEPGEGQAPPVAVVRTWGRTYRLTSNGTSWTIANGAPTPAAAAATAVVKGRGLRLENVAAKVGLDFRHGAFRYGVTYDTPAMMGGGLCWLDYDNDGWLDLFVVNSYGEGDIGAYSKRGGLPRTALFHNLHGRFVDVSKRSGAGRVVRGEGCVAGDLNGDGRTDLFVTTAQSDELLWNNGDGTFTESARSHGVVSFGWHSGAAIADINGDGRQDLFVAGYTEARGAIAGSTAGFPTNHLGVRDELFLSLGNGHFREIGRDVGLDRPPYDHSLGAVFTDANDDGRVDLYVANDEDPNRLYINELGGAHGFHFVDRARAEGVADTNAGMGIAAQEGYLFVTNSRGQSHAVYGRESDTFTDIRRAFSRAFGENGTGWGDSWVDLDNDGRSELVLANGEIPVKNLAKDAALPQVLTTKQGRWVQTRLLRGLALNGRGLAAADYDNDGRVDIAINSIGGELVLLRNTSRSGHWLDVELPRFAPGARMTAFLPDGSKIVHDVQAGSSYLSSEDPRVHFGLGASTRLPELSIRYPSGRIVTLRNVRADRIVAVPR